MSTKQHVLLVEDTTSLAKLYQSYMRDEPYEVHHVDTGTLAIEMIKVMEPDTVILDLVLPDMEGMQILKWMQEQSINTSVIIITAHGSVDTAVEAMRLGVFDFLEKPFSADRLTLTVRNALNRVALIREVAHIKEANRRDGLEGFIGTSLAMQDVFRLIDNAAPSKASVFITGESGTGKELCAQAIHRQSPRADAPFIALNCAAIPRDLIESEIFGHIKGAFTGAIKARTGAAAHADGGTLFLDEIGEMDIELQAKLLRFVQTGSYTRVGDSLERSVDVRFIAATNKDPLTLVNSGQFREDLYYRLQVIPLELPPLRERADDILLIAQHFLQLFSKEEDKHFERFADDAKATLSSYDWPGNVRQLMNVIRNTVVLNDSVEVSASILPPPLTSARNTSIAPQTPETTATSQPAIKPLWLVEKETIETTLRHCDNNIPKAAELLDVSPSTLYRKCAKWEKIQAN